MLLALPLAAQESRPLVFRCGADSDKAVEVQLCDALLTGLNAYEGFYNPDVESGNMTLFVDVMPLQGDDDFTVAAGFTVDVLLKRNGEVLDFSYVTATILTNSDKIGKETWTTFWQVVDDASGEYFEHSTEAVERFCVTKKKNKEGLYAWTKTSTCALTMNARLVSGASDTLLLRLR